MSRVAAIALAVAYSLFPVLFMVLATPPVHPRLSGSAEEQLRQLADAATRWRLVHLGLAIAGAFGALTAFSLGRLVSGWLLAPAARTLSVAGIASAAALIGVFWQEMVLIPSLAKACAGVGTCLAPENKPFIESFARLGWRNVPYLGWSGIGLTGSLLLLALLAWRAGGLRVWEALPLVIGCAAIIFMAPGLHGDAVFGFAGILLGLGSYAVRRLWTSRRLPTM